MADTLFGGGLSLIGGGGFITRPHVPVGGRYEMEIEPQKETGGWLAGFFDGEGTVRVKILKRERQRTGYEMTVRAELEQRYVAGIFDAEGSARVSISSSDYGDVPYNIGQRADMGLGEFPSSLKELVNRHCSEIDVEPSYYNENDGDVVRMVISGRESVKKFLLSVYPYSIIKREQIEIMVEEIIPRIEKGEHLHKPGFLELMEYVDKMNSLKGGNRGKYVRGYFVDEWKDDEGNWEVDVGTPSARGRSASDNQSDLSEFSSLQTMINEAKGGDS